MKFPLGFRFKIAAWFLLTVVALLAILLGATHHHLDEELRADRWDRSHPQFPGWVIHGSYTDEEVHDILGELMHVWIMVGLPLVALSVGVGYWLALLSIRPIRSINRQMKALDWQGAQEGISAPTSDPEIAELVATLNSLLARLSRSFVEMSEFSSKVAHELRTPLTLLRMRVERDAPQLPPDFSEDLQEEIHRLARLVERALLAAKAEGGRITAHPSSIDLAELLADLREQYLPEIEAKGIRMDWRVPARVPVESDPELLRQILHNLLGNAVRYGSRQARLRVRPVPGNAFALTLANRKLSSLAVTGGTGLGLRLVRSLTAALPQTTFRRKQTATAFAVRLQLPDSTSGSDPYPKARDHQVSFAP